MDGLTSLHSLCVFWRLLKPFPSYIQTAPFLTEVGEGLRGNRLRGNRTESLREENLSPRGSSRGPPKTLQEVPFCDLVFITSVPLGGFQRSSRRRRKIFLLVLPLDLSPKRSWGFALRKPCRFFLGCFLIPGCLSSWDTVRFFKFSKALRSSL